MEFIVELKNLKSDLVSIEELNIKVSCEPDEYIAASKNVSEAMTKALEKAMAA